MTKIRKWQARVQFFTLAFCFLTMVFFGKTNFGLDLDFGDSEAGLFDFFLCRRSISGLDPGPSDFEAVFAATEPSFDSSDFILSFLF